MDQRTVFNFPDTHGAQGSPWGAGENFSFGAPSAFFHVFERFRFQNPWGGVLYSGPPRLRTFTSTPGKHFFTITPDFPLTFTLLFTFTLLLLGRAEA